MKRTKATILSFCFNQKNLVFSLIQRFPSPFHCMRNGLKRALCFGLIFSLTGCSFFNSQNHSTLQAFQTSTLEAGFDTLIEFRSYTESEKQFRQQAELMVQQFQYYDSLFDIYNESSTQVTVHTLNQQAMNKPLQVEDDLFELLQLSKKFAEISEDQFDITLGNLLQVWHTYRQNGQALNTEKKPAPLPSYEELKEAYQHHGFDHLLLDEQQQTVYFDDPFLQLDVGAIAKGFAVEKVARQLEETGVQHAMISAGGNIKTLGNKPDEKPWVIGIANPDRWSQSLLALSWEGSISVVTSGDYQRQFQGEDGRIYHHIIDPKTLYPAEYARSVTIVTQDSGLADALSTTLFTLDVNNGVALLQKMQKFVPDATFSAVWIYEQDRFDDWIRSVHAQDSIPQFLNELGLRNFNQGEFTVIYTEDLQERIVRLK